MVGKLQKHKAYLNLREKKEGYFNRPKHKNETSDSRNTLIKCNEKFESAASKFDEIKDDVIHVYKLDEIDENYITITEIAHGSLNKNTKREHSSI